MPHLELRQYKHPVVTPIATRYIHGQTYHSTSTLHPPDGKEQVHGQLYIIEGVQAVATRMSATPNSECLPEVMEIIQGVMSEISPYAEIADAYRHMHSIEQTEERSAETVNREPQEVRHFSSMDQTATTNDEVAVVFVGEDGAPPVNRDIVVYPRDRLPQRISYMSCHLDPMCYPIPFHRGDPSWHNGMTHVAEYQTSTRKKVTKQQFYGYRLAVRSEFSPIHSSGKLFQQYAVDAYVKTEGCRLYYIRPSLEWTCTQVSIHNNCENIFLGLMDHLHSVTDTAMPQGFQLFCPLHSAEVLELCNRITRMLWPLLQSLENLTSSSRTHATTKYMKSLKTSDQVRDLSTVLIWFHECTSYT